MILVSPKTVALCISLLISVDLSTCGNIKIPEELGSISAVGREDFDFCKRLHRYDLLNPLNHGELYFIYWDTCSSYEMWQDPFTTIYKPRRLRGTPANKFAGLIASCVSGAAVFVGLSIYFSFFGIRLKNKIEKEGFLGPTEEDLIYRRMLHDNLFNRIVSKAGQRPNDDRFA